MSTNPIYLVICTSLFLGQIFANGASTGNSEAGASFKRSKRIVGGEFSNVQANPWIASVQRDGYHRCVGSIISKSTILTAASCVDECSLDTMIVRVGSSRTDSGGTWHRVVAVKRHENYTMTFKNVVVTSNNVALIKVTPPFEFGRNVTKVRLAEEGHKVDSGTIVSVAGWGAESQTGTQILRLKETSLLVVDSGECARAYGDNTGTRISLNNQLCAAAYASGFCFGDFGGPLVDGNTQIGIVSWSLGCASPRYPGVYTEVAHYFDWIDMNSQILESPNYSEKRISSVCSETKNGIRSNGDVKFAIPSIFGQGK